MSGNNHGSNRVGTSQGGDNAPAPPPVPPTLADAVAALVAATTQLAQNSAQGNRGRHNRDETTYVDFTDTRPPVFSRAEEPLEADDWLRTMEQKFSLIDCTTYQKPLFAAQQLWGSAGAWWANFFAQQPADHRVTWEEFAEAFRAHYIPEGVMKIKLEEFLALKQNGIPVMQYVGKFNHLSQYAPEHVSTDKKKKECFIRGLDHKLRRMLTTSPRATYHEAVDIAIAYEEENRQLKEHKKKKSGFTGPSGGSQKRQKFLYHPQQHARFPYRPPQYQQFQPRPQNFVRPVVPFQAPRQPSAPGIRNPTPQTPQNYPCYNCGKSGHFSRDCPYPRQFNPYTPRAPVPPQQ